MIPSLFRIYEFVMRLLFCMYVGKRLHVCLCVCVLYWSRALNITYNTFDSEEFAEQELIIVDP